MKLATLAFVNVFSFCALSRIIFDGLPPAQRSIHNFDNDIGLISNLWDWPIFQHHFIRAFIDYRPHALLCHPVVYSHYLI